MKLSSDEILKATNAQVLKIQEPDSNNVLFSFSTDTRTITQNDIYIPLKGEVFDGHNFIKKALESGAKGYFTSDKSIYFEQAENIYYVPDTKEAYLQLANFYKNKINPYTIAITGSSGKTTVKEMMYCVFKNAGNTVKSELNHNNEVGLCQTLSALKGDTKYIIVEMGMRGFGEIELLSKYTTPDIAVIVNAGSAHIGRLGSLLNIAKAKYEIVKYLKPKGILISHDNPLIREINNNKHKTIYFSLTDKNLKITEMTSSSSNFIYKNYEYKIHAAGEHNIQNALAVIETALYAGIAPPVIAKGLEEFSQIEKRWAIQEVKGFNIINDSYNSNPESVKAALKTFLDLTPSPKIVVLGDMGELGLNEEEYHTKTGEFLDNFDCDYVLTLGELAKYINPKKIKTKHFDDKKELVNFINTNLPKGSNILFKASRFMKFEEIIEELSK